MFSLWRHLFEEEDLENSNKESLFLAMEDNYQERSKKLEERTTLHAKVEPRSGIIDYGCLTHMIGDKDKFITLRKYDGGSMKYTERKLHRLVE